MSSPMFRIKAACAALLLISTSAAVAQSSGSRQTFTGLQLRGDQPITIESNELDVDDRNTIATFTGNVAVKQGEVQLSAGKLLVYYKRDGKQGDGSADAAKAQSAPGTLPGGSSQIDRLEATNNVYVKSSDQVATANNATFDMAKKLVTLTGNVVLTQGENVAEGCSLTIRMDTGVARLESQSCGKGGGGGRVRLMLTPGQSGSGQTR